MEYVNIFSVRSSSRLLEALAGKMIRVGTSLDAKKTVADLRADTKLPFMIVLGNEEEGISEVVKQNCDELVIIPWYKMSEGKSCVIDSLNVAQASSIIFYEICKK